MCICKMGRQGCVARATFWKSAAVVSIRFMDTLKDMLSSGTYISGITVPISVSFCFAYSVVPRAS